MGAVSRKYNELGLNVDLLRQEKMLRQLRNDEEFKIDLWDFLSDLNYHTRLDRVLNQTEKREKDKSLSEKFMQVLDVHRLIPDPRQPKILKEAQKETIAQFEEAVQKIDAAADKDAAVMQARAHLENEKNGLRQLREHNERRLDDRVERGIVNKNTVAGINYYR